MGQTEFQSEPVGRGIILYGSNDPDELVGQCAKDLSSPLSDPFLEEEFLVQSRGMGTWLQLQLAKRLGIFAQAKFRFPEDTMWMILQGFLADCPQRNSFTKEGMAWKIFDLLPQRVVSDPGIFASVARYLGEGEDKNGDRTFRLCRQVSTLFDSYLAYRPEMVINWTEGKLPAGEDLWQGLLWQDLRSALGQRSLPELVRELGEQAHPVHPDNLPERLSVFGISTMPPLFLDVLQAYGRFRPLRIYALQPAPVMWGEVESEKTLEKRWKSRALERAKGKASLAVLEAELNEERGNPLIGSLGRTGREFFNLLVDRDAHDEPLEFKEPKGDALLARLQRWTFDVFSDEPEQPKPLAEGDKSVTINSCHGPMREAEVLRDYLLGCFAEDETLLPSEVLVMMPDPEGYAPYLRAAFGSMEEGMPEYFPFSIVDREPRQESLLVDCFFDLLEFFDGRATNRETLDLLDSVVLRAKFELEDADLEAFRKWIRDCHAHWGLDAGHRKNLGSTETDEHTWRHALDRMALGFCMRGNGERMWAGVLPYDEIEGENSLRFAKLSRVVNSLRKLERQARGELSLVTWADFLEKLTKDFFPETNETLLDRKRVNEAISAIREEYAPLAGSAGVPLRALRYHLGNVLSVGTTQGRFLTRGVTFCGLRPMRSVSSRVVCLIGMNDGAFPRQTRKPSFDLSGERRPGDRSAREDDRYLFLETLWCAKEFLYLSYVGQSISQSQKIPPSVVLDELLDSIDELVEFGNEQSGGGTAREDVVQVQTLHSFGMENYLPGRLPRSYSGESLRAAKALLEPDEETPPFVSGPMSGLEDEASELSMDELIRFFENPSKAFLRETLGMSLWDENPPPEDCEPFSLDGLTKYGIKNRLLGMALEMEEEVDLRVLHRATGELPPGNLGEISYNEADWEVSQFMEMWGEELKGSKSPSISFREELGGVGLTGELGPFVNGNQLLYRCVDEMKGKDRLRSWLRHLFAMAFGEDKKRQTRFYCSAKKFLVFDPLDPDIARGQIDELLELYRKGRREALPFFAETSFVYQSTRDDGPAVEQEKAIDAARKKWTTGKFNFGEADDPAIKICFREEPFSHPDFSDLAQSVFGLMLESSREEAG